MKQEKISLLSIIIFFSLPCSAMDTAITSPQKCWYTKNNPIVFHCLPAELNQEILKNVIGIQVSTFSLDDVLKNINALVQVNKKIYDFFNINTDNLITTLSTNFHVSNEFVARMIRTEAASEQSIGQDKLLRTCLALPKTKVLISELEELSKEQFPINWNFTYTHDECFHRPRCDRNSCIRKKLVCSHRPIHCKKSKFCSDFAIQKDSWTLLMIMCTKSFSPSVINFLLTKKVNINESTKCGKNVLLLNFFTIYRGSSNDLSYIFLEQPNLNINHQDANKNTYLLWLLSCLKNDYYYARIKRILERGADPMIANNCGQTPLSLVDFSKQPKIFALLNEAIAKKNESR